MKKNKKQILFPISKFLYCGVAFLGFVALAFCLMALTTALRQLVDNTIRAQKLPVFYNATHQSFFQGNTNFAYADVGTTPEFAKIDKDTLLYKTSDITSASEENVYFILPKTYFVEVLSLAESSSVCKVKYNDIVGFVETSAITKVDYTPALPHYFSYATLCDGYSTHIRSTPSSQTDSNKTSLLTPETQNILVLGWVYGNTPNDGVSKLWYYCKAQTSDTIVQVGYVYSERLTLENQFLPSTEEAPAPVTTPTSGNNYTTDTDFAPSTASPTGLNKESAIILVIVFSIPILAIFLLLAIPSKRKNLTQKTDKKLQFADKNLPTAERNLQGTDRNLQRTDRILPLSDKTTPPTDRFLPLPDKNQTKPDKILPLPDKNIKRADKVPPFADKNLPTAERNLQDTDRILPLPDKNQTRSDKTQTKIAQKRTFFDKFFKSNQPIKNSSFNFPPDNEPL